MFSASAQKLDSLIANLERELNNYSDIDPDDRWSTSEFAAKSKRIKKHLCESCGNYRLTSPFEATCPICSFKDKSKTQPQFELPSVQEVLSKLPARDPNAKKAEPKAKGAEQKKEAATTAAAAKPAAPVTVASFEDFAKAHLQVAKIVGIKNHPEADKLYVCDVQVAEGQNRTICAGLVPFYKPEELNGRLVVAVLNLKPRKLKGVESQGMLLGADDAVKKDASFVLEPGQAKVGDRVFLEGTEPAQTPKELSSTIWTNILPELKVIGTKASFRGKALQTHAGPVLVPQAADGSLIH